MKKILLLFIIMIGLSCFSQKKTLYILCDKKLDVAVNTENKSYSITKYIISKDSRFQHDVYTFDVPVNGFDMVPFKNLSFPIDLSKTAYIKESDFFSNKTPCELHEELSLATIIFIREVQNENSKEENKYKAWTTTYVGTVKDIIKTAFHGNKRGLIDE